jgi:hypothetical protein
MAPLEEVNGGASFNEEQNLGWFVDAKEIRDGLLGPVIEQVEVFALQVAHKFAASIGDDNSHVDAIDIDANRGR